MTKRAVAFGYALASMTCATCATPETPTTPVIEPSIAVGNADGGDPKPEPANNASTGTVSVLESTSADAGVSQLLPAGPAREDAAVSGCESILLPDGGCVMKLFTLERCRGLEEIFVDAETAANVVRCLVEENHNMHCGAESFGRCAVLMTESPGPNDGTLKISCHAVWDLCRRHPKYTVSRETCLHLAGHLRPEFRTALVECLRRSCNLRGCFDDIVRRTFPSFP